MTDYLAHLRRLDLDVRAGLDLLDAADRAERIARNALQEAELAEGMAGPFYVAVARDAAEAADVMRAAHKRGLTFVDGPSRSYADNDDCRNSGSAQ